MKIPFNIPFLPEKANIYIQEALNPENIVVITCLVSDVLN